MDLGRRASGYWHHIEESRGHRTPDTLDRPWCEYSMRDAIACCELRMELRLLPTRLAFLPPLSRKVSKAEVAQPLVHGTTLLARLLQLILQEQLAARVRRGHWRRHRR